MDICAEERQILDFLRGHPQAWFSTIEVCRKAGHSRQFREDPRWAVRYLGSLRDKHLIETDGGGHFRLAEGKPG